MLYHFERNKNLIPGIIFQHCRSARPLQLFSAYITIFLSSMSCLFFVRYIEVNKVYERGICRENTLTFYNFTVYKIYSDVAGRKKGDSTGVTMEGYFRKNTRTPEVISERDRTCILCSVYLF